MKRILFPVSLVSVYLVVYHLLAFGSPYTDLVILMFVFSPFMVIWMVYRVLKDGNPSGRTFTEYFYDDIDYKRLSGTEND